MRVRIVPLFWIE